MNTTKLKGARGPWQLIYDLMVIGLCPLGGWAGGPAGGPAHGQGSPRGQGVGQVGPGGLVRGQGGPSVQGSSDKQGHQG